MCERAVKENLARSAALKNGVRNNSAPSTSNVKNDNISSTLSTSGITEANKNPSVESRTALEKMSKTSDALLERRDSHMSISRATSRLAEKSKRRYTRGDVEFLLKKAYINHKFIQAHLDTIPWDPKDQTVSESDLLQDSMLSPLFNDT